MVNCMESKTFRLPCEKLCCYNYSFNSTLLNHTKQFFSIWSSYLLYTKMYYGKICKYYNFDPKGIKVKRIIVHIFMKQRQYIRDMSHPIPFVVTRLITILYSPHIRGSSIYILLELNN